jgi:hypothetical protein
MDRRNVFRAPLALGHGVNFGNVDMTMDVDRQMFLAVGDCLGMAVIGRRCVVGTFKKHSDFPPEEYLALSPAVGCRFGLD